MKAEEAEAGMGIVVEGESKMKGGGILVLEQDIIGTNKENLVFLSEVKI